MKSFLWVIYPTHLFLHVATVSDKSLASLASECFEKMKLLSWTFWTDCYILRRSRLLKVQFSSVQDSIYALGKAHDYAIHPLSLSDVVYETVPMFVWLTTVLSRPFSEGRRTLPLSAPLSPRRAVVWCPWLCASGCVSSSSTPQIFRDGSHLWWLLCLPVCLLCHYFPSLQGSTSTGVLEGWCRPLTNSQSGLSILLFQCSKLSEHVRMMACVVWLPPLEAIQRKALEIRPPPLSSWRLRQSLSSWVVAAPCLAVKPHPVWFLVTEPSVYAMRSCSLCLFF